MDPQDLHLEVIAGDRESVATDLYSLGVSLYEVIVGTRPFHGETTHELLSRIASFEPATPSSEKRPDVPTKVSDLVAWLMRPDPLERLREAAQAEAEFQKLLEEVPN